MNSRTRRRSPLILLAILQPAAAIRGQAEGVQEGNRAAFDVERPPRGTVHDIAGKPIGGADVYFRIEPDNPAVGQWRNFILRTQPLPRVRTSKDGEFFLPLTHLHRLFTQETSGQITLIVEKSGYHTWVEPLGSGLRGYVGSRVVLKPGTAADRFTIRVTRPRPGMLVRVHRFGSGSVPCVSLDRWYEVPASGEFAATMPFVPHPISLGTWSNMVMPIGITVQLVFPGRTVKAIPLEYGQRRVEIGDKVGRPKSVCSLRRADGKKPVRPRGLYRCPDGVARWFPVDASSVVESPLLSLVALDDEGCVAAEVRYIDPDIETVELAAIPSEEGRAIALHDKAGRPVDDAQAYFFDLNLLPTHQRGTLLGPERARRRLRVEKGRISLPGRSLPGPGFLYIQARGWQPRIVFDPRAVVGVRRVDLGPRQNHGRLELEVLDREKQPVPGVYVAMHSNSFDLGAYNGGLLRTDRHGKVIVDYLSRGNHTVRLVGKGRAQASTMVRVQRDGVTVFKKMTLARAARYNLMLVDDDGRRVPFRTVLSHAVMPDVGARVQARGGTSYVSDSEGRLIVSDVPGDAVLRITDLISALVRPNIDELEAGGGINRVCVGVTDNVLMPLTGAAVTRECLTATNRTSNRNIASRPGCRVMLVRFPTEQVGTTLSIYMQGAPPMRLTAAAIATARGRQGAGMLFIDQRRVSRKVRIAVSGLDGLDVDTLRLELPGMNFNGGRPFIYGDTGIRVRRVGDGNWTLGLRDRDSYLARILHPEFLMQTLDIPAGDDHDGSPLAVQLTRGAPVTFRMRSTTPLLPTNQIYVHVQDEVNQMVIYQREVMGSALRKTRQGVWEFRLPIALKPGLYRVTLRVLGTAIRMPRVQVPVSGRDPVIIEVDKRRGRVASPHGDLKELMQQVERLEGSAKALRELGKTDKKSQARLNKVLAGIEAQLEAQRLAVERIRHAEKVEKDKAEAVRQLRAAEKRAQLRKRKR